MDRYFEWMDDRSGNPRWHLGSLIDEHGQEIDPWQFKDGHTLELGRVARFPIDVPGRPLDYCWAAFSIPVVHARVVQLFERLSIRDAQFIPVQIQGHEDAYFILNALRTIRCIDDSRCKRVAYWTVEDEQPDKLGEYRVVSGLRIDPGKAGGAPLFRPWGWPVALIISEPLRLALEAAGITGSRFVEV